MAHHINPELLNNVLQLLTEQGHDGFPMLFNFTDLFVFFGCVRSPGIWCMIPGPCESRNSSTFNLGAAGRPRSSSGCLAR